ncbi:MAG: SDR family oxidoreductase [Thermoplasmatota archaeon]
MESDDKMAGGSEDFAGSNDHDRSYALVTGGYKNLGYTIASSLKGAGYLPVITYRTDEKRARKASELLDCPSVKADLTRYEDVESLFDILDERGITIDILINNASSFHTGDLLSMNEEEIRNAVEGCIYPTIFTTQFAAERMISKGYGRIVNIGMAGIADLRGFTKVALHAASKTALLSLTLSYARELGGYGITVNMVSPGIMDRSGYSGSDDQRSDLVGVDLIQPGEVASAVIEIINDGKMNGSNIEIGRDPFG